MFNELFNLDRDGKLDAAERTLEYMNFCAVTGENESGNDEFDFADEGYDGEDDF